MVWAKGPDASTLSLRPLGERALGLRPFAVCNLLPASAFEALRHQDSGCGFLVDDRRRHQHDLTFAFPLPLITTTTVLKGSYYKAS